MARLKKQICVFYSHPVNQFFPLCESYTVNVTTVTFGVSSKHFICILLSFIKSNVLFIFLLSVSFHFISIIIFLIFGFLLCVILFFFVSILLL